MKLTPNEENYFHEQIKYLLELSEIKKMRQYIQHGHTSCLEHCLTVTYYSYLIAKHFNLKIDDSSLIRGGLLHDFFLYDWHDKSAHQPFHGFTHPNIALNNALKYFHLTDVERDIISHHMWPLTPIPPHTKEAYLINFVDKWCSLRETLHRPSKVNLLTAYLTLYINS